MTRRTITTVLLLCLTAFVVGCSTNPGSTTDQNRSTPLEPVQLSAKAAAISSATLYIWANGSNGQTVDIHRVTEDWGEMTVTWGNFGGAYDAGVEASFLNDAGGWRAVDVTPMVQDWLDGVHPNFGLLLNQPVSESLRGLFSSREGLNTPYLEVCATDGTCEDLVAIADAYIWEVGPMFNYGSNTLLFTGWIDPTSLEKQSLIRFDLPYIPELAAIGDTVWYDDNNNGIQESGEAGVPGVTVNLFNCQDLLLASTITNADGFYYFGDLVPGDYNVGFVLPAGYSFSPQDQGTDDATDSDADPITGMAICTTLDPGEYDPTWDAGIYREPQDGCTRTIGFWKNHAGTKKKQPDLVTPLLPVYLGTAGGTNTLAVTSAAIAVDVLKMKTYGFEDCMITKLYAQLLAAKLNNNNGASDADVAAVIAEADAYLADHDHTHCDILEVGSDEFNMVEDWKDALDDYNNGLIGPGHCE